MRSALRSVRETLAQAVVGRDAADQYDVDAALEATDPDARLENVGANAVLAISLANLLAFADHRRRPLYVVLGGDGEPLLPMPMVNIMSGGAHAGSALDIQDVLVVPIGADSFAQAIEWAARVRAGTAAVLREHGVDTALVADEGGLAAPLDSNEHALQLVADGIERAGLRPGRDVAIAIDVAANQLLDGERRYHLRREGRLLDSDALVDEVAGWCRRYPVVSIEDVLSEDDWTGWRIATERLVSVRQLIGDDLFATNVDRLKRGVQGGVANAILIKPNQAGSVSRAISVAQSARDAGYATILSARSGDTEDYWLADLAVGLRAGQIKVGSTQRSERTAKWNRLLQIEAEHLGHAQFAGSQSLESRIARPWSRRSSEGCPR